MRESAVVEDLVVDLVEVGADVISSVRFHHDVFGFTQSVVESVMVDLIECSALTLFRSGGLRLHECDQVLDNFGRIVNDVNRGVDRLFLVFKTSLDASVHLVTLEVDVLKLDETNTGTVLELVVLLQVCEQFVRQEQKSVLILESDHIVDVAVLRALVRSPQVFI